MSDRVEKEQGVLVRYLITIVLFMHGVGHLLFLANSWGYWKGSEEGRSWLIPLMGFVAVSWGYLTQQGRWPQLALASAAYSLAIIVL